MATTLVDPTMFVPDNWKLEQASCILGQNPNHQAHSATTPLFQASHQGSSQYAPTNIQAIMHTLSISPPGDQWYMDIGTT